MIKKTLLLLSLFVLCSVAAHAQGTPAPTGTPHQVTLTWQPPSPVGGSGTVASYNIYRTPSGPPNYTKINTTPVTALTLIDTGVTQGTIYGYCGTTVDTAGTESACTLPVNVTVPSNPNAPASFAGAAK